MNWVPTTLGGVISLEYGRPLPRHVRDESGAVPVAGSNGEDGRHNVALVNGPGIVVGRKGSAGKVTWFGGDFWPIDTAYYVRTDKRMADLRWLFYLLNFNSLERLNKSTGVPGLNRNDVYAEKCMLPPISEQQRIVEILDEVHRLRNVHFATDAKAMRILPALFFKMFGDPATNPKAWTVRSIGEIAKLVTSGSTPRGGAEVYVSEGPYLIRSQNVLMNRLELSNAARITSETHLQMSRTIVFEGDVLLNITGASIGRVTYVDKLDSEANVNQHVCIIRPNKSQVLPAYLSACLSMPFHQSTINSVQIGASRQALNHVQVRALKIAVPPIEQQHLFSNLAKEMEHQLARSEASGKRLDDLFSVLMQKAFCGQLTAKWREAHMKELLVEMEEQTRLLALQPYRELETIQ